MQTRRTEWLLLALLLCTLLALATPQASSQTGGGYDLSWNTVDGGGTSAATGGAYSLGGTIGAADAGVQSGGQYQLVGGFWGGATGKRGLYLPMLRR